MRKIQAKSIILLGVLLAMQTGCGSHETKTETAKSTTVNPADTLKIFLQVKKMEIRAYTLMQAGAYDSALSQLDRCISFIDTSLKENNHKGLDLLGSEIAEMNETKESIYDSLKQPENGVKCMLQTVKWAELTKNYVLQITSDMKIAVILKNMAANTNGDTAKKGTLGREAIHYSMAGAGVIDSLKTNDMDDLRYKAFHLTSKIYDFLGDKKQARAYDKKYKDVYFKIYNQTPPPGDE